MKIKVERENRGPAVYTISSLSVPDYETILRALHSINEKASVDLYHHLYTMRLYA